MSTDYKKLYRSRTNRMVSGVCGGLGEFANVDPTIIRLLFAAGTIFSGGILLLVYLAMIFVVPEAPEA
jgi:phage shock protein PspC (stress-responsive transcriptional regulator)